MILTTYKSWEEPASTIRNDHESKPFKTRKSCGKNPPRFWESQNLSKPGQDIIAPLRSPYPFGNVSQHRFLGESGMETILRSGFFRFVSCRQIPSSDGNHIGPKRKESPLKTAYRSNVKCIRKEVIYTYEFKAKLNL